MSHWYLSMHDDRISSPLINVYLTADHQSRRVIDDDGETHQVLARVEEFTESFVEIELVKR